MINTIPSKKYLIVSIIPLLFIIFLLQVRILAFRGMPAPLLIKPGEFAMLVALGGLRGVAADLLYLKADEFWQKGQWENMMPLYRAITILQPNYVDYWSIAGYHLAWSMPFQAKTQKDEHKYIQQGIEFLKEGISYNPDVYKLYFDLAFIYDHKLHEYDKAIIWYKKAGRFPGHPSYIDRAVAHNLKKKGDWKAAREEWLKLKEKHAADSDSMRIIENNLRIVEEELRKR